MKKIQYLPLEGKSMGFFGLIAFLGIFILAGLGATYFMEHNGHWVTGKNNQIV